MYGAAPGPNSILRATNSVENKKKARAREELLRHYLLCRAAALESINFKGICN
jgi:hypothetical protein